MYNAEFCDKLNQLLEDEQIVSRFAEAQNVEEFQAILAAEGVEMQEADVVEVLNQLNNIRDGELSEEMLDEVNGGCPLCAAALVGSAIVVGYIVWKVGKAIIDAKYK